MVFQGIGVRNLSVQMSQEQPTDSKRLISTMPYRSFIFVLSPRDLTVDFDADKDIMLIEYVASWKCEISRARASEEIGKS